VVERADFEKIALQMIKSNMANFGAYKYQTEWRTLFMVIKKNLNEIQANLMNSESSTNQS
jgi:hypothetical protein